MGSGGGPICVPRRRFDSRAESPEQQVQMRMDSVGGGAVAAWAAGVGLRASGVGGGGKRAAARSLSRVQLSGCRCDGDGGGAQLFLWKSAAARLIGWPFGGGGGGSIPASLICMSAAGAPAQIRSPLPS